MNSDTAERLFRLRHTAPKICSQNFASQIDHIYGVRHCTSLNCMSKPQAQIDANKTLVRERLTDDITSWSRECVLPYPKEFEHSIDLLLEASLMAVQGRSGVKQAQHLIQQMLDAEMRTWFDALAQNAGAVRLEILNRKPNKTVGKNANHPGTGVSLQVLRNSSCPKQTTKEPSRIGWL